MKFLFILLLIPQLLLGQRIAKPPHADSLWKAMQECSGWKATKKQKLKKIKWVVIDTASWWYGGFFNPDTIKINRPYLKIDWVSGHEILHYLRPGKCHGPTCRDEWHDYKFAYPCNVEVFQHPEIIKHEN